MPKNTSCGNAPSNTLNINSIEGLSQNFASNIK